MSHLLPFLLACTGRDAGGPADSVGGETGETGAPPLEPIHGPGLTQHGVQVCADPGLRESFGPLERVDLGDAWARQAELVEPMDDGAPFGPGITVADLDGDGAYDVVTANKELQLYTARGGVWTEEAKTRLPSVRSPYARGTSAADYDGDGDLDLYVAGAGQDLLLQNDGTGHFVDVTKAAGLEELDGGSGQGATWADVDGDTDLDLYVSNRRSGDGPDPPDPADPNLFWENLGDGTFADRTSALFEEASVRGYTFVSTLHDFDADGDPDLYVVNDFGSLSYPNAYLRNDSTAAGMAFTDVASEVGLELVINGMGVGVGDVNGDVYPDLVVTDWGAIHLMESMDGVWFDAGASRGLRPNLGQSRWLSWGVELVDLDNDGRSDVPIGFAPTTEDEFSSQFGENPPKQPDDIYLQEADGSFASVGDAWGFADTSGTRGILAVDLDRDGWLDLFQRSFDAPAQYFHQRCGESAWLAVELIGLGANRQGVGARVTVEAGEQIWHRWVQIGGTSLSVSGPAVAHFGLGDLEQVDRVTVAWRDGTTSLFQVIDTRQRLTITQAP